MTTRTRTTDQLWPGMDESMPTAMMFSLRGTRRAEAAGELVAEHAVRGELHVRALPCGDWQLIRVVRCGAWKVEWRGRATLIGRTLQAILRPVGAGEEQGFVASYRISRDGMGIMELVLNASPRPEDGWTTIETRGVLLGRSERAAS